MKTDKVFTNHPNLEEYFQTSDGKAFYNESDARIYAKKLEDKKVQHVQRGVDAPVSDEDPSTDVERDALIARYTELFGKAPAHNAGNETIAKRIEEKEAELQNEEDETED